MLQEIAFGDDHPEVNPEKGKEALAEGRYPLRLQIVDPSPEFGSVDYLGIIAYAHFALVAGDIIILDDNTMCTVAQCLYSMFPENSYLNPPVVHAIKGGIATTKPNGLIFEAEDTVQHPIILTRIYRDGSSEDYHTRSAFLPAVKDTVQWWTEAKAGAKVEDSMVMARMFILTVDKGVPKLVPWVIANAGWTGENNEEGEIEDDNDEII